MEQVFSSRHSRWIMGMYWFILVFIISLTVLFYPISWENIIEYQILVLTFSFISFLFIAMIYRAYTMSFTVTKSGVTIRGVFSTWTVPKSEIKTIKKTLIPVGFKLFGSSFLGGYYYIPALGRARVAMTNFKDGVLITTKENKHHLITPENPDKFIKAVKGG